MIKRRSHAMAVFASRLRGLPHGTRGRVAELTGVAPDTMSRWRQGLGTPNLAELEALAETLGVSIAWLISDRTEDEVPRLPPSPVEKRNLEQLVRDAERILATLPSALDAVRSQKR
jgi:transcriptional regulator with XRE-family HTH domain